MIKFYKCTYNQYMLIWLKERIQNFIALNINSNWTIDQFINQFLKLNQNQNQATVKKIFEELLKSE